MTTTLNPFVVQQFSGTENYYFNPLFRHINYTDGVKYIGDNGASWLVTDILAVIATVKKVAKEEFISVTIRVTDGKAKVVYDDGNGKVLFKQDYDSTNFPMAELKFFYTNNVLMLASEY